jgi:hypothetical protein
LITELVIFAVACLIGFLAFVARKRKIWIQNNWIEYAVKTGDDIRTLAEKFDVSWKLLAKVNVLQAPYSLKKDQKLKVPPKQ